MNENNAFHIGKENEIILLKGKRKSWDNFFGVIFGLKYPPTRADGGSLGNFWAFVQFLQEQFAGTPMTEMKIDILIKSAEKAKERGMKYEKWLRKNDA